jgi:serine/threonine-protein kinase
MGRGVMMQSILPEKVALPPSAERTAATQSLSRLPDVMLEEGAKRLGIAGLLYSATFFFAWFGPNLIFGGFSLEFLLVPRGLVSIASILLGIGLFILTRYGNIRLGLMMDLGLVFLVVSTFGISMANFWGAFPDWHDGALGEYTGIPWECVWIIVFPLIAPNTPRKILVATLFAASTAPLTLLLSRAVGLTSPETPMLFLFGYFIFTTYLCAGIAYVSSLGIYKIGARLKRAQEIGSYQLVDLLGAGGMGEVWVAEHRMLARPAAIKLIRPEMLGADGDNREMVSRRFEREARATASLHSYHTITLYDFGITEDESFYYVMELLEGMNLDELVKIHGPVNSGRAAYLLQQVCHSLDDAHRNGMIHRDIKPANIFVSRLGSEVDFIKVLDFGLVKTPDGTDADAVQLTQEGMAFGTPGFMAPEIAMGEKDIDKRVDIYGVGCVAYWLLTGQRVFQGETPMAEAIHHIQSEPVPPSQKTDVDIPNSLEKIVLKCLEKDPADRPQSAHELGMLFAQSIRENTWNQKKAQEWWVLHIPESKKVEASANGDPEPGEKAYAKL